MKLKEQTVEVNPTKVVKMLPNREKPKWEMFEVCFEPLSMEGRQASLRKVYSRTPSLNGSVREYTIPVLWP